MFCFQRSAVGGSGGPGGLFRRGAGVGPVFFVGMLRRDLDFEAWAAFVSAQRSGGLCALRLGEGSLWEFRGHGGPGLAVVPVYAGDVNGLRAGIFLLLDMLGPGLVARAAEIPATGEHGAAVVDGSVYALGFDRQRLGLLWLQVVRAEFGGLLLWRWRLSCLRWRLRRLRLQ